MPIAVCEPRQRPQVRKRFSAGIKKHPEDDFLWTAALLRQTPQVGVFIEKGPVAVNDRADRLAGHRFLQAKNTRYMRVKG